METLHVSKNNSFLVSVQDLVEMYIAYYTFRENKGFLILNELSSQTTYGVSNSTLNALYF